eukprot:136792-Lingulodinium_polyedra.AAC.1
MSLGPSEGESQAWLVYIDNLEILEIPPREEAQALKGSLPQWLKDARVCYDVFNAVGNDPKD